MDVGDDNWFWAELQESHEADEFWERGAQRTPNMQSTEASSWVLVTVHPAGAGLLRALGRDVGTRKSGSQARAGCGRCGPRSQKFSAGSKFKDSLFAAVSSSPTLETARCSHKLLSRLLDLVVRR